VVNSIGVRREEKAVGQLTELLKDSDREVVEAASVALGHIGGSKAAHALLDGLTHHPESTRPALAEGCILCAENFFHDGKMSDAQKLYDAVRAAGVPWQLVREGTRGAILARVLDGLPLLIQQIRAIDKEQFGMGLHVARELGGREVSVALAAELNRLSPERQAYLLMAIGDRRDSSILPIVVKAAQTSPDKVRVAAIGILETKGQISTVPVLLELATTGNPDPAKAAVAALSRLPGKPVDAELMKRFPGSTGKTRQVLIQLAELRGMTAALPEITASIGNGDPAVRSAAVSAVGSLGDEKNAVDLVKLLQKTTDAKARDNIEGALIALCGRIGASSVQYVLPLTQSNDAGLRIVGLHALASAGGPGAVTALKTATEDRDEAVQDEAVRTLSTWPNNWPEDSAMAEPLLGLARNGRKTSHQVLGLRGYLQYVRGDKKLSPEDKVARISEVMPLLKQPQEQRQAAAILETATTPASVELLTTLAAQSSSSDEVCTALMKLVNKKIKGLTDEQHHKALQVVAEKASDATLKKQAEGMLKVTKEAKKSDSGS